MTDKNDKTPEDEVVIDTDDMGTDDDVDLVDEEERSSDKLKALRDKLKACEEEKMSHLEELQRLKADFLNSKRRLEEERERDKERAMARHVEKLLPLCDSFHMAMADKKAWDEAPTTWRQGVEGIYAQLQSILSSYNVTPLSPEGEDFDPNRHEALSNMSVDDKGQHNKVVAVIQQGFVMKQGDGEILIRPARVSVGEYSESEADAETSEETS